MKRMLLAMLCLSLICSGSITASAKEGGLLSPGMNVISERLTMYKTGISGRPMKFTPEEFEAAVGLDRVNSITVLSLPDAGEGTLCLSATPVMVNQVISRKALSSLTFLPVGSGEVKCSFRFGVVSASQPLTFECQMSLVPELNFAPSVLLPADGYLAASTIVDVPLYDRLPGTDPEGDDMIWRVSAYPSHGTLRITSPSDGSFVYTPLDGYRGSDSFRYVVYDAEGNRGEDITVAVRVEPYKTVVQYCDLEDSPAKLAAYRLAEKNLMIGRTIGGKTYFDPEGAMTRAEFLALVMSMDGRKVDYDSVAATSFEDDDAIPTSLRAYVSLAEKEGYAQDSAAAAGNFFFPNKGVTLSEAAHLISGIMDYRYDGAAEAFADSADSTPAWARDSLYALAQAGVISEGEFPTSDQELTRADAAMLLWKLMEVRG